MRHLARHIVSSIAFMVFAYLTIAVFDTLLIGHARWSTYIAPAVGCGIGMYLAHRSDFGLAF